LFTSPNKINTVDLIETKQSLLIVSGGDDQRVNLQRISQGNQGGNP
jgi:hypothetical protein